MKRIGVPTLVIGLLTTAAVPFAATPQQAGVYTGTAKKTYYNNDAKVKETVPFSMTIWGDNRIDISVDNYDGTSPGNPIRTKVGGFYDGLTDGSSFTATFQFKIKGEKSSIKGNYQFITPYVIESGTFTAKRTGPVLNEDK